VTTQETQQGEARGQGRHVVLTTFDVGRLNMEAHDNQQAFQVSDSVVELPCRVITDASTSEILLLVGKRTMYYDLDSEKVDAWLMS
jgi:hypothetical protein